VGSWLNVAAILVFLGSTALAAIGEARRPKAFAATAPSGNMTAS
jgi:hypothetical protein